MQDTVIKKCRKTWWTCEDFPLYNYFYFELRTPPYVMGSRFELSGININIGIPSAVVLEMTVSHTPFSG